MHQHPLLRQVLVDHLVDSVKPPECELDRSAVESDHTHHILVDEVHPVFSLECFNSFQGLLQRFFYLKVSPSFFLCTSPLCISNTRYL